MSVVKHILCLANSKKMSGRCVAGREVLASNRPGAWVRPISARPSEEVSEDERQYKDGSDPRLLDVTSVQLIRRQPHACQTENWLLDPAYHWTRVRRVGWGELQGYVETPPLLWTKGRSTINGSNDEILRTDADALPRSLYLINVASLELKVFAPGAAYNNPKRRVLADFRYGATRYAMWVTDPIVEREYLAREDGAYRVGESCLCVSLGEPFRKGQEECRYKLVAGIIRREGTLP